MSKANFNRLKAGIEEAIAHLEGRPTKVRVTHVPTAKPIDAKAVRKKLGLSQSRMAVLVGQSRSGYIKWESGERTHSGPALMLLKIADREPEAVLRALTAA